MERRNEGSFEANSCCGWDFSVVVEGSSPWNNHNTHWTLTFGNYSQKECAGDRLGWLFPTRLVSTLNWREVYWKNLTARKLVSVISLYHISYYIRSKDWDGHSRSLILCSVTHFCVVFEVCVWIIVQLEDPNMAHYKISNWVSHLLICICWYLIESMMPCV